MPGLEVTLLLLPAAHILRSCLGPSEGKQLIPLSAKGILLRAFHIKFTQEEGGRGYRGNRRVWNYILLTLILFSLLVWQNWHSVLTTWWKQKQNTVPDLLVNCELQPERVACGLGQK